MNEMNPFLAAGLLLLFAGWMISSIGYPRVGAPAMFVGFVVGLTAFLVTA